MAEVTVSVARSATLKKTLLSREKSKPIDYELTEASCSVAKFDSERVSRAHNSLHDSPVLNAFNFRYYKASVFGATLVPLLAFLVIFYATLLIYYNVLPSKEIDCKKYIFKNATIEKYDFPKNSPFKLKLCKHFNQEEFEKSVKSLKDTHKTMVKVLSMLLGFYVSSMMNRWWKQVTHLPSIENVAMTLNGIIVNGSKGEKSALELKKRILRHCLFSYALVMASVSKAFEKLYPGSEEYVVKGLATYDFDIHNLKNENGSDVGWMDKWWVPINWSCALIQKETDSEGHAPKESKEIIAKLISFKSYLREVLEFHHNPLPAMMSQAVYLVCWGFLIFGAFAHQPCNGSYSGVWWIFEDLPLYQLLIILLFFAWLRMAEICKSPFDGDAFYDIDMSDHLEKQIWAASTALESSRSL